MDWNRVEGNWKDMKGKIKEKWGKLTDDDLTVINGKREQLEGRIQQRYGYAKDQAKKDVDDWYRGGKTHRPMKKPWALPGAFYLPLLHRDSGLVDVVAGLKPP